MPLVPWLLRLFCGSQHTYDRSRYYHSPRAGLAQAHTSKFGPAVRTLSHQHLKTLFAMVLHSTISSANATEPRPLPQPQTTRALNKPRRIHTQLQHGKTDRGVAGCNLTLSSLEGAPYGVLPCTLDASTAEASHACTLHIHAQTSSATELRSCLNSAARCRVCIAEGAEGMQQRAYTTENTQMHTHKWQCPYAQVCCTKSHLNQYLTPCLI